MGEVGVPHRVFLYELSYWQLERIRKGYRKRNKFLYQMLAEQIFATVHVMRKPDPGRDVTHMFRGTGIFDSDEEADTPEHSEEDIKQLQDEMKAIQEQGIKI